jgi:phosphoribosylformylglycinamidine synthase
VDSVAAFEAKMNDFPFTRIGVVTTSELFIDDQPWGAISHWRTLYDSAIEKVMAGHESEAALSLM